MKKSRFSESQIINILKQANVGSPVPELCREHRMSSALFSGAANMTAWTRQR
jgi:putative transposase